MMCRISKVVCLSVGDKSRSWGRRAGRGDEEVEEKGGGEGGAEVDRDEEEKEEVDEGSQELSLTTSLWSVVKFSF